MKSTLIAAAVCLMLPLFGCTRLTAEQPPANPFFPFCMDTHDSMKRTLPQQAEMLSSLDFDGAGHLWLDGVAERLETFDAAGLRLFQIYLLVTIEEGKPAYDARLKDVLPLLKGRDIQIALLIVGGAPSDVAGDARGVEVIREIADLAAQSNVSVVLYPHADHWLERVEDAVRLVQKSERQNVGAMFNLCHWLKVDDSENLEPLLDKAMPYLTAVSVNGLPSATDLHAGKGDWVQPLDSGDYDVYGFLEMLWGRGYRGPIGLQCWSVGGDAKVHLARSMQAWQGFLSRAAAR